LRAAALKTSWQRRDAAAIFVSAAHSRLIETDKLPAGRTACAGATGAFYAPTGGAQGASGQQPLTRG